jgi:uncharacterized membrane protein
VAQSAGHDDQLGSVERRRDAVICVQLAGSPHFVIPIDSILVAVFLLMEARRYRYYEIWASRVRVIEMGYYAPMLAPDDVPRDKEWASHLASDLLTPHFTISVWEANRPAFAPQLCLDFRVVGVELEPEGLSVSRAGA